MNEPFTLPGGVSLGRRDVYEALAVVGIAAYSSVTIARGSVLTHTFLDRARGRSLRVVESEANQPSEVVGDWALWRRVRAVACELAGRGSVKFTEFAVDGPVRRRDGIACKIDLSLPARSQR